MKIQNDPINFFNYLHNRSFPTLSVLQEQKIIDTLFVLFVLYLITSAMECWSSWNTPKYVSLLSVSLTNPLDYQRLPVPRRLLT